MNYNILKAALLAVVVSTGGPASAGVVTHGDLTTDDATSTILDTVTGRLYMRFDEFNLSVDETFQAVATGGVYDGWSVATADVAFEFYDALLRGTPKSSPISGWADGDFGATKLSNEHDQIAFLSETEGEVGLITIRNHGYSTTIRDGWTDYATLDGWGIEHTEIPINLMLYRDSTVVADVPEPASLAIFALGLMGLAWRRFKKQS